MSAWRKIRAIIWAVAELALPRRLQQVQLQPPPFVEEPVRQETQAHALRFEFEAGINGLLRKMEFATTTLKGWITYLARSPAAATAPVVILDDSSHV